MSELAECKFLTAKEVAHVLSVDTDFVRILVRKGELAAPFLLGNKRKMWRVEDVQAYLDQLTDTYGKKFNDRGRTIWDNQEIPAALVCHHATLCEFKDFGPISCVYFLIKGSEVAYVGQTTFLSARIAAHQKGTKKIPKKDFDRVFYIPMSQELLGTQEWRFIKELKPSLNIQRNTHNRRQMQEK